MTGKVDMTAAEGEEFYILPSSFGQERFWALDRQEPGNPTWNVPARFRLEGELDSTLLERAFNAVIARHEVLRTTFRASAEGPLAQIIAPSLTLTLNVIDLRSLDKAERDAEVDRLSFEEARRRFDLTKGPLFRIGLLRIGDREHILLFTPHHSVADYISIGLITDEIGALYESYVRGSAATLPEPPIQYGDFAVWQREQANSEIVQSELAYWTKQLENLTPIDFPTDVPRPDFPTYDATITSLLLPPHLTDAIRDIGTRHGATFFNTMLSVLDVLVYQYTGQTALGIATQVSGRTSVELEKLIGLFANTIVLRANLAGNPTLGALLAQVQDIGTEALARPNVRFEQILKALRPNDYPNHHTLFRINFICQRDPVKPIEFAGIKLTVIPSKSQGALYELNVFLVQRNEGWRLACEYNTDLFRAETIVALLENYRRLLEAIAEKPERRLDDFPKPQIPAPQPLPERPAPPAIARVFLAENVEPAVTVAEEAGADRAETDEYAFDLTLEQQRFWQLDQLMPGNPALNMQAAFRLHGPLVLEALQRAFTELSRRHDILRTTFEAAAGSVKQIVHPSSTLEIQVREVPTDTPNRDDETRRIAQAEAAIPFDLARGPLIRVALAAFSSDDHLLMITMPHIICDGWSNGVLVRELTALYEAYSNGQPSPLAEPSIQYVDFACWQKDWLEEADLSSDLGFWKQKLSGQLPLLELPADHPPAPGMVAAANTATIEIPREYVDRLKDFCKREEVTLFMFFLAAFKTLLYRYSGQEDLLVGSPVAGRAPGTENVIGPFSYPICMRTNLAGEPSARELMHRIRDVTLEALAHKDLPFGRVLEDLQMDQLQGRTSPFQFYFLHQTAFLQPAKTGELSWTPLTWVSPGTSFDLHLATLERPDGIVARLEYKSAMFEAATIQRMMDHLRAIVQAFMQNPEARINELKLEATEYSHPLSSADLKGFLPHEGVAGQDAKLRICDRYLQQQLTGIPGEVCIAGLKPSNTTEGDFKFGFAPDGESLLRTGRVGRYRADGTIEDWGSPDQHLDLRGCRLALAKLEEALRTHPAVLKCAAIPAKGPAGDQRPLAYVVADAKVAGSPTPERTFRLRRELCQLAEERCPDYPKLLAIALVEALQVDSNSEVIRTSLPPPTAEAYELGRLVAPRDELETALVKLWEEALGIKSIGVHDSFFDLGGNSVIAARLFTQINETWERNFPLSTLFAAPTIAEIAHLLRDPDSSIGASSLVAIRAQGTQPPLFIISGIGGNVVRFHALSKLLREDQPVYALQPPGLDGNEPYYNRIEDLASHFLRAMRTLQPTGPYYLAGYSFGGIVTFEIARQILASGDKVAMLAMLDAPEWRYDIRRVSNAPLNAKLRRYGRILRTVVTDSGRFKYLGNRLHKRFTKVSYQVYKKMGWEFPQHIGDIQDVNIYAAEHYVPQRCDCHITVFRSKYFYKTPLDDENLGWTPYAARGVESYEIPGTHDDITSEPNVRSLAEQLQNCIDKARIEA